MQVETLVDGTIQISFTYIEKREYLRKRRILYKKNVALYNMKNPNTKKRIYRRRRKEEPVIEHNKKKVRMIVIPIQRGIWPPTLWSQAYYFSRQKVNTRLTKKEARVDEWFEALYMLINKRSVVLPEVWNKLKVTKYILLSDYRKGKNIYDTILQYTKHANTDKATVLKNRIPTAKKYKSLPPTSKWKRIAKDEDFRLQGID